MQSQWLYRDSFSLLLFSLSCLEAIISGGRSKCNIVTKTEGLRAGV